MCPLFIKHSSNQTTLISRRLQGKPCIHRRHHHTQYLGIISISCQTNQRIGMPGSCTANTTIAAMINHTSYPPSQNFQPNASSRCS